ncbi:MAG: hypothetical protein ACXAEF_16295, partial [Candidatus Thorarchaeota archaeon]
MVICFILDISTPSTYSLHSPAVGLVLTVLFAPVLLIMFKKKEEEDPTQLNLSYKILLLFLICLSASWNITAILFPDLGINPGSILGAFAIPLGVLIFVYKVPLKKLGFTGGNSRNIL